MKAWRQINSDHIDYYVETPLYYKSGGRYFLYKPGGRPIDEEKIKEYEIPLLYVKEEDFVKSTREIYDKFNNKLSKMVDQGSIDDVVNVVEEILNETFSNPRSGGISFLPETVDLIIKKIYSDVSTLKNFIRLKLKDFNLVRHSMNVMGLVLRYAIFTRKEDPEKYAIAALLHDVGKTEIKTKISKALLSDEEFEEYSTHPIVTYDILSKEKSGRVSMVATDCLKHHEKIDGTGYPYGKNDLSEISKIIAIADSYDNLTSFFKEGLPEIEALRIIREEAKTGQQDIEVFKDFVKSLNKQM